MKLLDYFRSVPIARTLFTASLVLYGAHVLSQGLGQQVDQLDRFHASALVEGEQAKWVAKDVLDMSTDGGNAIGYFREDGTLFRADVRLFGEGGRSEYSLLWDVGSPVLVRERSYVYNRPYYWSLEVAQQSGDDEVFDPEKTVVLERSVYFDGSNVLNTQPAMVLDDHGMMRPELILDFCKEIENLFVEDGNAGARIGAQEHWKLAPFASPGPPLEVDTALCGIVLNDASSARRVLGAKPDRVLVESEQFPQPHVSYRVGERGPFVALFHHGGNGSDQFAEMQLSLALPDMLHGNLMLDECKSSAGIALGMTEEQALAILGDGGLVGILTNGNRLLRYRVDGEDSSGVLDRFGYPSYYMSLEFGKAGLVEYRFGFEYP